MGLGCPMGRGLQEILVGTSLGGGSEGEEEGSSQPLWPTRTSPALPGQVGSQVGTAMTDRLDHVGPWGQRLGKLSLREGTVHSLELGPRFL